MIARRSIDTSSYKPRHRIYTIYNFYRPVLLHLNGTSSRFKQVQDLRGHPSLAIPYPLQSLLFAKLCALLKQMDNDLNWKVRN